MCRDSTTKVFRSVRDSGSGLRVSKRKAKNVVKQLVERRHQDKVAGRFSRSQQAQEKLR